MLNFDLHIPTRILFGRDTHKEIGTLLQPYAKKVLLHFGGASIKKSGLYDAVTASLKESDLEFVELGGVVPNPRVSLVREGIARLRGFYKKMGLPSTLSELGIDESKLEVMAQKATGEAYGSEQPLGNLKKLYWQDVLEIYKLAK